VFDFGLSLIIESQEDQQVHLNHSVGTFGYMAPELKGVSIFTILGHF
jgi:serine/threonine protein kinase